MLGHKIDMLRRTMLGGDDEITFILAIFIVHDDDHLAFANVVDQFLCGIKSHRNGGLMPVGDYRRTALRGIKQCVRPAIRARPAHRIEAHKLQSPMAVAVGWLRAPPSVKSWCEDRLRLFGPDKPGVNQAF